jgi:predicted HicB family RNase H-like nuclease
MTSYNIKITTVHFSAEDEVFYGKIIGINDLVSFEGTTVKELKIAFEEAVEDYLETCRIPSELHRQAALFSAVKNMSLNDFVRYAIDFTLAKAAEHNSPAR